MLAIGGRGRGVAWVDHTGRLMMEGGHNSRKTLIEVHSAMHLN